MRAAPAMNPMVAGPQMGGSPLQYSELKGPTGTQALAKGVSNYFEVLTDHGPGGEMAMPVPIKAKASCPTSTPKVLPSLKK